MHILQAMVRCYVTMRHNSVLERCAELEAELFELRSLVSCCCGLCTAVAASNGNECSRCSITQLLI